MSSVSIGTKGGGGGGGGGGRGGGGMLAPPPAHAAAPADTGRAFLYLVANRGMAGFANPVVLLVKERYSTKPPSGHYYNPPGGQRDPPDGSLMAAAMREFYEETGGDPNPQNPQPAPNKPGKLIDSGMGSIRRLGTTAMMQSNMGAFLLQVDMTAEQVMEVLNLQGRTLGYQAQMNLPNLARETRGYVWMPVAQLATLDPNAAVGTTIDIGVGRAANVMIRSKWTGRMANLIYKSTD